MSTRTKIRSGMTLTELVLAAALGILVVMVVGILLVAGQEGWVRTFNDVNKGIYLDAVTAQTTFGSFGRRSNKSDYHVYKVNAGKYVQAAPPVGNPTAVVSGDAVEFRYWDGDLTAAYMNTSKSGTTYMFFYLENKTLKADVGSLPPGAVNAAGTRNTGSITTRILAANVASVKFSHTARNAAGDGNGCVKMDIEFLDQTNGRVRTLSVMTATLLRNVWP